MITESHAIMRMCREGEVPSEPITVWTQRAGSLVLRNPVFIRVICQFVLFVIRLIFVADLISIADRTGLQGKLTTHFGLSDFCKHGGTVLLC